MKSLLNCHSIGLHSFIFKQKDGYLWRVFYADTNHNLWRDSEIAIHPHHVDIEILVLDGHLYNPIYQVSKHGVKHNKYKWNSHILNGSGGFEYLGQEGLVCTSNKRLSCLDGVTMKACELHTIVIPKGVKCVWLIIESKPSCDYSQINYSKKDLSKWNSDGLYQECDTETYHNYMTKYLPFLKQL